MMGDDNDERAGHGNEQWVERRVIMFRMLMRKDGDPDEENDDAADDDEDDNEDDADDAADDDEDDDGEEE